VTGQLSEGHGLEDRLERFRAVRRDLEASVLPLATSVDGRRFSFQASLHALELRVGGYVVLGEGRLGQVLGLELALREGTDLDLPPDEGSAFGLRTQVPIRHARGEGTVLEGDGAPFHDAPVAPAAPEEVRRWLERTRPPRARLPIGELATAPGVGFALDAGGFDRHTFMCGQSGSGKTYSLGVILEQLLLETSLRIVILDPNSDYVRLTDVRAGTDLNRSDVQVGLDDRGAGWMADVRRAEDAHAGADAHTRPDDQGSRVEEDLGADPRAIADHADPAHAAMNNGVVADRDTVADVEGLEVFETDVEADVETVADATRHRPPDHPAHSPIERAWTRRKACVESSEVRRYVRTLKVSSQTILEIGIGRHRATAVDRGHDA